MKTYFDHYLFIIFDEFKLTIVSVTKGFLRKGEVIVQIHCSNKTY